METKNAMLTMFLAAGRSLLALIIGSRWPVASEQKRAANNQQSV